MLLFKLFCTLFSLCFTKSLKRGNTWKFAKMLPHPNDLFYEIPITRNPLPPFVAPDTSLRVLSIDLNIAVCVFNS